jgi:hypothetical protein
MALKALYPTRDLMQKVIDRLGLYDKPQTDIANPLALLPYINFNIDVDELCKEPNYTQLPVSYSAGIGSKLVWTVPDDEIAIDPIIAIDTQSALRTASSIGLSEDDTGSSGIFAIFSQAAAQTAFYIPTYANWRHLILYPGEALWVYMDVNAAGGTFAGTIRYIRLKTKEVLL